MFSHATYKNRKLNKPNNKTYIRDEQCKSSQSIVIVQQSVYVRGGV